MSDPCDISDPAVNDFLSTLGSWLYRYRRRDQRLALREGLATAARLCDMIAADAVANHKPTKLSRKEEAVATRCADAIWALRSKIEVPDE